MAALGVVGGLVLCVMGAQMALTAKAAAEEAARAEGSPGSALRGPVLTGILTSVSNPYFPLWWATIGLTYAAYALKSGLPGLVSFYTGHILADLVWYTLIAVAVASGRRLCSPTVHRWLIVVCGVILLGLGAFFAASGSGRALGMS